MQVRAGDSPGLTHLTNQIASGNHGAGCNIDGIHVAVKRDQAMAVIEDDGIAIKEKIAGG